MRCANSIEVKLRFTAAHYGLRHQLAKTKEELAELAEAIDEHLAKPTRETREHVVEEIWDVYSMIWQDASLLGVTQTEMLRWAKYKVNRQIERIEREKCRKRNSQQGT